ncbi:calcium/sodium antiporter [Halomonas litopenaei]|uniref:Calcium/sodium antiporter n=3 Tax=Halomonas TaxID=2745 RepID=A0AAU7KMW6_9GAMM|nr:MULTISPECIES: calcium/sodium antiporter [Halomonas]MBY5941440.1 calcium/sodium antiporter [Halomonas sp. DP5N14-9]MBY6112005.1 calcium/sodium antiporter [Halomonas sp. DP1Y21-3]PTL89001.1 calcium/sodium antiporter [Halomonas litopenaei]PTL89392.1 calcium/sodium antiporter [Halomonas sp. SYSU XM8]RQW69872.1 calcium/sodium antiporter [Halomonas sp. YLB-10]|tara:strand:- start:115 stop:1104 length:990 start_codon:yes stop_codon:yes gene_type:complete
MLLPVLAVLGGLVVLVWSAERFVEGAAATAARLGLSPLLVGMLVIGFGTSAPELTVSALSAAQGNPGLALGNAYGSNIANIGLILGLVALISPLAVHSSVIRRELPVLGAATLVSALMMWGGLISRLEGALLLLALLVFMVASVIQSRREEAAARADALATDTVQELDAHPMSLGKGIFLTVLGLALLVVSSRLLVWGAVDIAQGLGVSDVIIGLTVVAIGTSLPELASSISALRRKEHDLVLGNVVGSNLFNTLGVVGLAAVIAPIEAGREVLMRDWSLMTAMTLMMAVFALGWKGRAGRINRFEGGVLVAVYLAYTAYLVSLVLGQS